MAELFDAELVDADWLFSDNARHGGGGTMPVNPKYPAPNHGVQTINAESFWNSRGFQRLGADPRTFLGAVTYTGLDCLVHNKCGILLRLSPLRGNDS